MATSGESLCRSGSADGTSWWDCSSRPLVAAGCGSGQPGTPRPRARRGDAGRADPPPSFPAADEDYFHDMDGGAAAHAGGGPGPQHVDRVDRRQRPVLGPHLGRAASARSTCSRRSPRIPTLGYGRATTAGSYLGLVNEPCFTEATGPDPNRYGLWLDVRDPKCPPDPFANDGEVQGRRSRRARQDRAGRLLLRRADRASSACGCFPNPDFDEKARKRWDSERYYNDPSYYDSRDLVRPYRVGMSCGFCHVGPESAASRRPIPRTRSGRNLSSNVGAQYFWVDRIFNWQGDTNPESFFNQLLHTSRPGLARHVARLAPTTSTTRGR